MALHGSPILPHEQPLPLRHPPSLPRPRYVVSAGPGEFAGKVIGQQDLAALLAAR
jgi:hypothetical protein